MNKTCPVCGKVVVVSPEELTMRNGVVVCPQCLSVFDADGKLRKDSPKGNHRSMPEQPEATKADDKSYNYCPDCGKPLPGDVRFCPYCGIRLSEPVRVPQQVKSVSTASQPRASQQPMQAQPTAGQAAVSDAKERKWTPMLPSYSFGHALRPTPASLRARIVGYTVIGALIALLGFILYQGYLIM